MGERCSWALFCHSRCVLGIAGGGSDLFLEQGPQHYSHFGLHNSVVCEGVSCALLDV